MHRSKQLGVELTEWENVKCIRRKLDVLEEETTRKYDCDMEKSGTLNSDEKIIAVLGNRWWPQTAIR